MDGVEVIRYRYAPARWERLVNDGGIVTNLKRHRWMLALVPSFVLIQAWCAWRLIRRRRIALIHAHWLVPQGLIAALLRTSSRDGPRFVVTSHGADLYALRGKLLDAIKRFVVHRASAVSVVSSAMLTRLELIGAQVSKVRVLPMGVDLTHRFVPSTTARDADEILFVGRLVEKKGLGHLIAVMPGLLKRRPGVRLTIAGFGPDAETLKSQVMEAGLSGSVTFLGAVKQDALPALYRRAAVFVAPFIRAESGDQEGLPVALTEAVGCGCPAVAGNVDGIEDIFGAYLADFTVDSRDHEALASCILAVLSDPVRAQARVLEIRARLIDRLEWDNVAERYAGLLSTAARA